MQFKLYEKNEITLKNRMKTLKSILLLVLVTTFLISCGDASETNDTTPDTAEPTTETTTGETPVTNTTTSTSAGASQITDAVVQQACDCQENARREDNTIDFPKVGECMGGKNKIQFVADLLGAEASDKDRSDAEVALVEKMKAKCPQ